MAKKKIERIPETLDLELYAGDGVSFRVRITSDAQDPVEITGVISAQIRQTRAAGEVMTEFAAATEPGAVVMSLTGSQTASLVTGEERFEGVWDLQWTPEGAEPTTLVQGEVTCDADVTR